MGSASTLAAPRHTGPRRVTAEPPFVRWLLIGAALLFLGLFLFVPLAAVFAEAFAKGIGFYLHTLDDVDTVAAIKRTFIVAGIAVPFNCVFGVAAAWAIAKFDFRGKNILLTLIDLPFSISPVIAGLIYVLVFGAQGWLGLYLNADNPHFPWLQNWKCQMRVCRCKKHKFLNCLILCLPRSPNLSYQKYQKPQLPARPTYLN